MEFAAGSEIAFYTVVMDSAMGGLVTLPMKMVIPIALGNKSGNDSKDILLRVKLVSIF